MTCILIGLAVLVSAPLLIGAALRSAQFSREHGEREGENE